MVLTHMGSLNALWQSRRYAWWWRILGRQYLPSADRIGDVAALTDLYPFRQQLKQIYARLKRRKAIRPMAATAYNALVIDGHECCASFRRHCPLCLRREITTSSGKRTQYYHRFVMGILLCENFVLLLDIEMQKPGEDEVACATRLLRRLLQTYPRAFDLVMADGLYARATFFKFVIRASKHAIAVLKDDRRELIADVAGLSRHHTAKLIRFKSASCRCWDFEQLSTWSSLGRKVRVVRSVETAANGTETDWWWVTTIEKKLLPTDTFIAFAHRRWDIENRAFNELVNHWHADHVYNNQYAAIEFFWLLTMLAFNIFQAFYFGNLKPQRRQTVSKVMVARLLFCELFNTAPPPIPP